MTMLMNLRQRLTGCMAALGRFISLFGNKALPFFKIMKQSGYFKWTPEAAAAFEGLKDIWSVRPSWSPRDLVSLCASI